MFVLRSVNHHSVPNDAQSNTCLFVAIRIHESASKQCCIITYKLTTDSEVPQVHMLLQIITSVGFVVPPERVSRVKPGNLYVRRTSHGLEFVRKKERRCGRMDQPGSPEGRRRSSSSNCREQCRIWGRRVDLEAEFDHIEEVQLRNAREAVQIREAEERRNNDKRARLQDAELGDLIAARKAQLEAEAVGIEVEQERLRRQAQQAEAAQRGCPERRRSSGYYSFTPGLQYAEYQNHQQHSRRTSHHNTHPGFVYYPGGSPLREYFPGETYPTSPRHHHRCPHHRQRQGGAPWVCDIVIEHERRRSNVIEPLRRQRSTHFLFEGDYEVESRSPQDYWYY